MFRQQVPHLIGRGGNLDGGMDQNLVRDHTLMLNGHPCARQKNSRERVWWALVQRNARPQARGDAGVGFAAGNAADPGVFGNPREGFLVEVFSEEDEEAAKGPGGLEGDTDAFAAVDELVHFDMDAETRCSAAGMADGGFADAHDNPEEGMRNGRTEIHGASSPLRAN